MMLESIKKSSYCDNSEIIVKILSCNPDLHIACDDSNSFNENTDYILRYDANSNPNDPQKIEGVEQVEIAKYIYEILEIGLRTLEDSRSKVELLMEPEECYLTTDDERISRILKLTCQWHTAIR